MYRNTPIPQPMAGEPISKAMLDQLTAGANTARVISGDGVDVTSIGGLVGIAANPQVTVGANVAVQIIAPTLYTADNMYEGRIFYQPFLTADQNATASTNTLTPVPDANTCVVWNGAEIGTTGHALTQNTVAFNGRVIGVTKDGLPLVGVNTLAATSSSGGVVIDLNGGGTLNMGTLNLTGTGYNFSTNGNEGTLTLTGGSGGTVVQGATTLNLGTLTIGGGLGLAVNGGGDVGTVSLSNLLFAKVSATDSFTSTSSTYQTFSTTYTIPGGYLTQYQVLRIRAAGGLSWASGNINFRIQGALEMLLGTLSLLGPNFSGIVTNSTNGNTGWAFETDLLITQNGTAGTFSEWLTKNIGQPSEVTGHSATAGASTMVFPTSDAAAGPAGESYGGGGPITIDMTVDQAISFRGYAQMFGAGNTAVTMKLGYFTVETLGLAQTLG